MGFIGAGRTGFGNDEWPEERCCGGAAAEHHGSGRPAQARNRSARVEPLIALRAEYCARNSAETPVPGTVPPSLRGSNTKAIPDLFPNSFRGFNPCLALRETHVRELGSFDHSRTIRFEHAPIIHKRKFSKPMVLHAAISQWSCIRASLACGQSCPLTASQQSGKHPKRI